MKPIVIVASIALLLTSCATPRPTEAEVAAYVLLTIEEHSGATIADAMDPLAEQLAEAIVNDDACESPGYRIGLTDTTLQAVFDETCAWYQAA